MTSRAHRQRPYNSEAIYEIGDSDEDRAMSPSERAPRPTAAQNSLPQSSVPQNGPPQSGPSRSGPPQIQVEIPWQSFDPSEYRAVEVLDIADEGDGDGDSSEPREASRSGAGPKGCKEVHKSFKKFSGQLPGLLQETQKWLTKNRPPITGLAQVKRLLPRLPIGRGWTAADQAATARSWVKEARRDRLLDSGGNKNLLTMYKSCLRLMRCLPEDIVSCQYDLAYDPNQKKELRDGLPKLVWSVNFCRLLTALFVHPLFAYNLQLLVVAIQYAVIVDTDDWRGPWGSNAEIPEEQFFLASLLRLRRDNPGRRLDRLRKRLNMPGDYFNLLFQRLEDLADGRYDKKTRRTQRREASGLYMVHREHLEQLIKALDTMTNTGLPLFLPLEIQDRGINGRRSPRDYPLADDLRPLREYAILRERERARHLANLQALDDEIADDEFAMQQEGDTVAEQTENAGVDQDDEADQENAVVQPESNTVVRQNNDDEIPETPQDSVSSQYEDVDVVQGGSVNQEEISQNLGDDGFVHQGDITASNKDGLPDTQQDDITEKGNVGLHDEDDASVSGSDWETVLGAEDADTSVDQEVNSLISAAQDRAADLEQAVPQEDQDASIQAEHGTSGLNGNIFAMQDHDIPDPPEFGVAGGSVSGPSHNDVPEAGDAPTTETLPHQTSVVPVTQEEVVPETQGRHASRKRLRSSSDSEASDARAPLKRHRSSAPEPADIEQLAGEPNGQGQGDKPDGSVSRRAASPSSSPEFEAPPTGGPTHPGALEYFDPSDEVGNMVDDIQEGGGGGGSSVTAGWDAHAGSSQDSDASSEDSVEPFGRPRPARASAMSLPPLRFPSSEARAAWQTTPKFLRPEGRERAVGSS